MMIGFSIYQTAHAQRADVFFVNFSKVRARISQISTGFHDANIRKSHQLST